MRLFLSSENLGNYSDVFLNMVGNAEVGLIENAKDDWTEDERKAKVQQHMEQFTSQGFTPQDIDLRDYFGNPNELKEKINGLGGLFIHGGNTFILRRAMAASGLDKILQELVSTGQLAYGGSSAGSCVMAKSLKGMEDGDKPQPEAVPSNYPIKETIWEGVGLVPFAVVPHYKSNWFGDEAEKWIKYLEENNLPYKALKDGQVIVINGDKEEFLT